MNAARGGGADERAAVGGVTDLLVGDVTVEVGVLIFVGYVDDVGAIHVRAEIVDDGLFLGRREVGSDCRHNARVGVGGRGDEGSRHHSGRDGASDTTRTNRGNVHSYLLSGSYALRRSIPARCGGGLCVGLRLGGGLAMTRGEWCRWAAGAPRFDNGREEDADSRQLSLPFYSGFAMTREVWRLACSGVDLAMMRRQSYRLAPPGATFGLGIKNGRHRLLRCRPHNRGVIWCSDPSQRRWGQPRARQPRRRGGCRGCDLPLGWEARRTGPCGGAPSARPRR